MHFGVRQTWVEAPAPPFTYCVILGNFFNFGPLFSNLENGHNNSCPDIHIDSKGQYIFEYKEYNNNQLCKNSYKLQCLQDQTSNGNK